MFNNERFNSFVQFFITYLLMPILCVFILGVCLIIFATTSHAESSFFPMQQNENSTLTSYVLDFINNDSQIDVDNNYVATGRYEVVGNYTQIYIVVVSKSNNYIFAEKLSNGYQFSYYFLNPNSYTIYQIKYKTSNPSSVFKNSIGSLVYFQNLNSSLYDSSVSYASNLRIYTSANDDKQLVLKYGSDDPDPIGIGVAIIPPEAFVPDYPSGTTPPSQVPPTYTTSDYTWTTPPIFDSSSIENAIGSIQNTLGWIANNLKEEFKNLTNNLKGLFKFIADTIQYYGNAIIDTLNNFIQNFYDNMAALVQPIFEKIAYFTEPIDSDAISDAIDNTSFVGIKNQFTTFFTTFENAFDIAEPNTFTLTINIQNIDTFYNFGCRSPVIIHLDEHFTPIKAALRTFLWILISFGSVFVVERGLSDWLRGENDTK